MGQEDDEAEQYAAFGALGGRLTWDELARFLGYRDEQALSSAVSALPERQRQAVVFRKQLGLSEIQAAKEMRVSTGAMRSHPARAVRSLGKPSG
jgi:DNA-directed RNA polymerase specialized sigma24 family protein